MTTENDRLDEITEQVINDFGGAQYDLADHDEPTSDDLKRARATRIALRARIRTLVEEARKEGEAKVIQQFTRERKPTGGLRR